MLIALSGGADSVALLLLMLEKGQAEAAAHCHFGLRGAESDRDEAFVRRLCEERGVKLHVRRFDTRAEAARTGESVEMAARRLRYAWFAELRRAYGYGPVAVAHHRDDQAETLLLNLTRGSGLRGLAGMAEERDGVVRPLLHWSRRQILDFLARKGQTFVDDSTNTDTRLRRNFMRHRVLPLLATLNPHIARTLADTADRLREAHAIFRLGLDALRERMVLPHGPLETLRLDCGALAGSGVAQTLLHEWLSPYGFTAAQLAEALCLRTGGLLEAPPWLLTRCGDSLVLARRPEPLAPRLLPLPETYVPLGEATEVPLGMGRRLRMERRSLDSLGEIPRDCRTACLDVAQLRLPLTVRSAAEGDRFQPFGLRGTQTVADYLTRRHRSRIEKLAQLVVCDAAGIVWLVGERPAARACVGVATREVVLLHLEQCDDKNL